MTDEIAASVLSGSTKTLETALEIIKMLAPGAKAFLSKVFKLGKFGVEKIGEGVDKARSKGAISRARLIVEADKARSPIMSNSNFLARDAELIAQKAAQYKIPITIVGEGEKQTVSFLQRDSDVMSQITQEIMEERLKHNPESVKCFSVSQNMNDFLSAAFGANLPSDDNAASKIPHNSAISSCSDKRAEQAPPKGQSLLRQKGGASSDETAEQHFIKSKYNKTKNNQSIISAQDEISDDGIDRIDDVQERDIREKYKQIVRENIEYDCFAPEKQRELDELVELMVEVICSNKPTIRANGEELPQEVVKSQFLSLNESHIEYVLSSLKKNTSDIRNIRNYLITALYNAPSTISSFWSAEVNHDLFGK